MDPSRGTPTRFRASGRLNRVWIWAGVLFLLLSALFCGYAGFHWSQSVREHDMDGLAAQAGAYLSDFYELSADSERHVSAVTILKTEKRGNYLAALCRNGTGRYSVCVFARDALFHNRWRVSGGSGSRPGEMGSWNAGLMGEAVLVFFGAELPDDAAWYRFRNNEITYICPIVNHSALNLFVIPDADSINGIPELLDAAYSPIL